MTDVTEDATAELDRRGLFPIPAAATWLGVGRSTVYKLLNEGRLRSVRVGGRRLIPSSALADFVEDLEASGAA